MSDLEVLAVNTDFEADRKTIAAICKAYGAFRTEDRSDLRIRCIPILSTHFNASCIYCPKERVARSLGSGPRMLHHMLLIVCPSKNRKVC